MSFTEAFCICEIVTILKAASYLVILTQVLLAEASILRFIFAPGRPLTHFSLVGPALDGAQGKPQANLPVVLSAEATRLVLPATSFIVTEPHHARIPPVESLSLSSPVPYALHVSFVHSALGGKRCPPNATVETSRWRGDFWRVATSPAGMPTRASIVGPDGIEPSTCRLRVGSSTTELRSLV